MYYNGPVRIHSSRHDTRQLSNATRNTLDYTLSGYYELCILNFADDSELECFLRFEDRLEDDGRTSTSGRYVVVWFAGPSLAHCAHSVKMSGWLERDRRMEGRGADAVDDVMLDRRRSRCEGERVDR